MPRADRLQGTVRKELLKASKASGQTKLSFSTQSVVANDNAEHDYTTDDNATASASEASTSTITSCDEADNPWIKAGNADLHFPSNVKQESENKGRYFQKECFQHHNWLWYHRGKSLLFVEYVLHLDSHMIPRRSSLLTRQMALKTGRRARKE